MKARSWHAVTAFATASLSLAVLLSPLPARGAAGGIGAGDTSPSAAAFPVRGPHTYGDGLGAGRGHQGQDLLARCGRPVVAARAGRVRVRDSQPSGAGNFVVIRSKGKRRKDFVYMHMLKRISVRRGERVEAGDRIGSVGSSGRSSACHLHFEMWSAPGWYRGGSVLNPTPSLKRWDRAD